MRYVMDLEKALGSTAYRFTIAKSVTAVGGMTPGGYRKVGQHEYVKEGNLLRLKLPGRSGKIKAGFHYEGARAAAIKFLTDKAVATAAAHALDRLPTGATIVKDAKTYRKAKLAGETVWTDAKGMWMTGEELYQKIGRGPLDEAVPGWMPDPAALATHVAGAVDAAIEKSAEVVLDLEELRKAFSGPRGGQYENAALTIPVRHAKPRSIAMGMAQKHWDKQYPGAPKAGSRKTRGFKQHHIPPRPTNDQSAVAYLKTTDKWDEYRSRTADLAKAGPYMGPRGGKWADPAHTIPWKPSTAKVKRQEYGKVTTRRNWIKHNPAMPKDTAKAYQLPGGFEYGTRGGFQPKREALHNRIIDDAVRDRTPAPEGTQKIAIVMMGGPASGKTSLVKGILGQRFDQLVNVNPDDVKELLPEWKIGLESSAKDTAYTLHMESSHVAKRIFNEAVDRGLNMLVDGTGRDASKHMTKIKQLQKEGYHVTLLMPDLDTELAVQRSGDRAEATGRYVPPEIIREAHHKIPSNFETIAREADSFAMFDTRGNGVPAVLKWSGGQGEPDRMHDPRYIAQFRWRAERLKGRTSKLGKKRMQAEWARKSLGTGELSKGKLPPVFSIDELAEMISKYVPPPPDPNPQFDRDVGILWPMTDIAG